MEIKDFFAQIGGDYEEALMRLMNDALITRMLKKFAATYDIKGIVDAYNNKRTKEVFEKVHSLKGVSGNLSLSNIYKITEIICDKTRNLSDEDYVLLDEEIKKLENEFNKTVLLINQI